MYTSYSPCVRCTPGRLARKRASSRVMWAWAFLSAFTGSVRSPIRTRRPSSCTVLPNPSVGTSPWVGITARSV